VRIALDIRPALREGTGVGTVVEELVRALDAAEGDHELRLFTSSFKDRWDAKRLAQLNRSTIIDAKWPVKLLNPLWHWIGMPKIESFVGPVDVAHSPTPLILPAKAKKIITLHDLYFFTHPEHTHDEIRRDYHRLVRRHTERADLISTVSHATKDAAVKHLGIEASRLRVCRPDASSFFDEDPCDTELDRVTSLTTRPFFLFVGTNEPRKNAEALINAFAQISSRNSDVALVFFGARGWKTRPFDLALESIPDKKRVIITGYRDRYLLRALYHRAIALVMPSHCEGFGLPLVEAMACGCPLIVRETSAMPEVAGDAAKYWSSGRIDELASIMESLFFDNEERSDLIQRGRLRRRNFSWKMTAKKTLLMYDELGSRS